MPVDRSKLYNFAKQTKLPPVVTTTLPSYGKLSFGIVNSAANGKRVSFSKALAKSLQLEENGSVKIIPVPALGVIMIGKNLSIEETYVCPLKISKERFVSYSSACVAGLTKSFGLDFKNHVSKSFDRIEIDKDIVNGSPYAIVTVKDVAIDED